MSKQSERRQSERQSERRTSKREMKPLFAFFYIQSVVDCCNRQNKAKMNRCRCKNGDDNCMHWIPILLPFQIKTIWCVCVCAPPNRSDPVWHNKHIHIKSTKQKAPKFPYAYGFLDLIFAGCHTPLCACPFCVLLFELSFFEWFLFFICLTLMTTKTTRALHEMHTVAASQ